MTTYPQNYAAAYHCYQKFDTALRGLAASALQSHEAKASERPTTWGYADDLEAFDNELINAIDRVGVLTAAERNQHGL